MLWDCELNQEKRTWTVKPQKEGKQDSKLLLSTICLGEKAKEEMNLVEILPPASPDDKQAKPITIASLQASVLPMVSLSPPASGDCPPWAPAQASPPGSGWAGPERGCRPPAGGQRCQRGPVAHDREPWVWRQRAPLPSQPTLS